MAVDPNIIGPATLAVGQSISAFQAFIPKFTDIRRAVPNESPEFQKDVRMGEIAAMALTIGVGVIASSLTGSHIPAFVSIAMCLLLFCLYESALKSDPTSGSVVK